MSMVHDYEKTKIYDFKFPGPLIIEPSKISYNTFEGDLLHDYEFFNKNQRISIDVLPVELGNKLVLYSDKEKNNSLEIKLNQISNIETVDDENGFMDIKKTLVQINLINNSDIILYFEDYKITEFISLVNNLTQLNHSYWKFVEIEFSVGKNFYPTKIYFNTPFLAKGEQLLWSYVGMGGVLNKKASFVMALTNFRSLIYDFETHQCEYVLLSSLDEIAVKNPHRVFRSTGEVSFSWSEPNDVKIISDVDMKNGRQFTIGDIVFSIEGEKTITFGQMENPQGLAEFAKLIKENVRDLKRC